MKIFAKTTSAEQSITVIPVPIWQNMKLIQLDIMLSYIPTYPSMHSELSVLEFGCFCYFSLKLTTFTDVNLMVKFHAALG